MATSKNALQEIVSKDQWSEARRDLLVAEKEATRALDALAARRRRLPMTEVSNYTFTTESGTTTLLELFGEQQQLVVYQFMDVGPDGECPGCTGFTNNVSDLDTLARCGVAWATVSDMPIQQIAAAKAKNAWTLPFYSSRGTTFSTDCDSGGGFVLSAFIRDGDSIYRSYNTHSRGVDRLLFVNNILDLAPYGRQEDWEDSPAGWPQHPTYG